MINVHCCISALTLAVRGRTRMMWLILIITMCGSVRETASSRAGEGMRSRAFWRLASNSSARVQAEKFSIRSRKSLQLKWRHQTYFMLTSISVSSQRWRLRMRKGKFTCQLRSLRDWRVQRWWESNCTTCDGYLCSKLVFGSIECQK